MASYQDIDVTIDSGTFPFSYNPVHAIWQCLLKTGMPSSWLNSASFLSAAEDVYDEGKGVSVLINRHEACITYLKALLNHIDAILFYGPDSKFHIRLLRDDYVVDDLPVITIGELLEEVNIERGSWMDTISEIKIQYNKITEITNWQED
jgi:hypothetical protein